MWKFIVDKKAAESVKLWMIVPKELNKNDCGSVEDESVVAG